METKTTRIGMETEIYKNLKTLAETKATCYCLRETGQCDSDDCLACSKLSLYQQGVRNLLPVDLLKIDNLATKIIQRSLMLKLMRTVVLILLKRQTKHSLKFYA